MERNNLKAVIFDLDGVITDSAKYTIWRGRNWRTNWGFLLMRNIMRS